MRRGPGPRPERPGGALPRPVLATLLVGAVAASLALTVSLLDGPATRARARRIALGPARCVAPATANAASQVESAAREAALLEDPGPSAPSWPTTSGAAWIARYRGRVVNSVRTADKLVALTFDDGPDGSTRRVVDVLDSQGARATFFVRGEDISALDIDYAVSHGNEIGNHTASHVGLSGLSGEAIARQLDTVDQEVFWAVGRRPLWVRGRAGAIGRHGLALVSSRGQLYANWSVSADDTDWSLSSERIARNVLAHVRPGSIVLLHQTRPDTVTALPLILSGLKQQGYRCVTLSRLAEAGEP